MAHSEERIASEQVNLPEAAPLIYRKDFHKQLHLNRLRHSKSPAGEALGLHATLVAARCFPGLPMGSIANAPTDEGLDQPTIDERRALIGRVAASVHFKRSARLRDFLLYVGNQSLKEGCPEIHEQEIGAKVFGRSSSYDRSQDNIVRVNATELRKRIEQYFATEGAHETLVLEIPRGGYKPVFHRKTIQTEAPSELVHGSLFPALIRPGESIPAITSTARSRASIFWAALCLTLAAVCIVQFQQNRSMRKSLNTWDGKPAVAAFWGDFLRYRQQTDVVLPDDSLSLTIDLVHHPISLGDYLSRNYMRDIQSSDLSADRKSDLDQVYSHNLVTFGGVRAAQQMLAQIPVSLPTHLTLSRYYTADAIKRNNVILVGGKKANPWVHLFDDQMNFVTDFDNGRIQAFVANLHPAPGELPRYDVAYDSNALVGYSVIAYLPNPGGTGNAIILAGTDSDATDAAAEFLTSEDDLEKFQNILHVKTLPYFEVLLKTSRLSGTSLRSEPLAYRTYPGLH
jgi:hypothetical protein